MKINGEFIMREVAGDAILIPVGNTALQFNGIIALGPVGALSWEGLTVGKTRDQLLSDILEKFEIDTATAEADLDEFLDQLAAENFIEPDKTPSE